MSAKVQIEFGKRVRALRLAAGRSQEDFAALANIDRASFGKLERGLLNPSLVTLARVEVALKMGLAELLAGVEIDPDEIRNLKRSTRGRGPMGGRGSSEG
jgi:transcriptional regulator with XRE-family HTH domain